MLVSTSMTPQEVEGIWVDYQEGVRFRIARAGNPNFLKASDRLEAPFRKEIARGKLGTEKQLEIQCKSMAEALLLDWEGIETEEGPLEYSKTAAYKVLRYNVDIRDFVFEVAIEQENFRQEGIAETGKKSATS